MTRTCRNCGYVNETADKTSVICPNCGVPYSASFSGPHNLPKLATNHASPFTVPSGGYLTPPPAVTAMGAPLKPLSSRKTATNRRNLILGVVVVILLAALSSGYAFYRSRVITTPAKTGTILYNDPQGQFTITYPMDWTLQTGTIPRNGGTVDLTRFAPKSGIQGLIVAVSKSPLTNSDAGAIVGHFGGIAYQAQGTPTTINATNGQWQSVGGAYTLEGQDEAVFVRSTKQSTLNYLVILFGPAQQFNGPLLNSLNGIFATFATKVGA